jgi:hypothetical protein
MTTRQPDDATPRKKAPPGTLARECVDTLYRIAYTIDHARIATMLPSLDWLELRRYAAEVITWAAEEDGMMDGMMGGEAVLQALSVKDGVR